jgi:hypothetical protein
MSISLILERQEGSQCWHRHVGEVHLTPVMGGSDVPVTPLTSLTFGSLPALSLLALQAPAALLRVPGCK